MGMGLAQSGIWALGFFPALPQSQEVGGGSVPTECLPVVRSAGSRMLDLGSGS